MVASSIEVYKREVLGYLFGRTRGGRLRVSYGLPLQTSRRRFKQVTFPPPDRDRRVATLDRFLRRDLVGDYHSHTDFDGVLQRRLSSHDRLAMHDCGYPLSIVVSVETGLRRTSRWRMWKSDPVVYGAIRVNGSVYGILLRAYTEEEGRIRRARLSIPL